MNTKKIAVLEKAIQMLENGFNYNWYSNSQCNCGVVCQAIGISASSITTGYRHAIIKKDDGAHCEVTGLPFGIVQEKLKEVGFTKIEIMELEYLGNPTIAEKAEIHLHYMVDWGIHASIKMDVKDNLLSYLRAWVSILKEQDAKEQPKSEHGENCNEYDTACQNCRDGFKEWIKNRDKVVRIAVPESISKQAKELILS